MRLAPVAVLLAACSFSARSPGGDDGGGGSNALVDDTAADFAQGSSTGWAIDPQGALEPVAYAPGGLRARAYDGKHVSSATTSWHDIETEVAGAMLRGVAYEQLPANWGGSHPKNLGLSAAQMPDDNFTVIYDGELLVTAGAHTIDIDADDAGAIEIDPDGTGFQAFTLDAGGGAQMISIVSDRDRWIPIRMAIGDSTGNSQLTVHLDGAALTPDITRARVTQDHGLLGLFYFGMNGSELVAGPVAVDTPNVDWGMAAPPYDLDGAVPSTYTARLLGQIRIDQDGMYTLAATPSSDDDQTELFIDRHLVSRVSIFQDSHPMSATIQLTAGWHAIAIELAPSQKNILGGADPHDATLATTIARDGGAAMPVTADMLRPAAMSGYFALSASAGTPLNDTIIANGVTMIGLPAPEPAPPMGAVIESATPGIIYKNATPTDYTISLAIGAAMLTIPSTSVVSFLAGDETAAHMPVPTTANDATFTVTDTVTGGAGQSAQGFAGYNMHGGPLMPFAPASVYTSAVREVPGITGLGPLTVTGDLDGASLVISVRTAASAAAIESATWVDVKSGQVPAVTVAPFVQYRLTVDHDGWAFPRVDKVELDYTR